MKITAKLFLILFVPTIVNFSSTPSTSSETKLYICNKWKKVSYAHVEVEHKDSIWSEQFILKVSPEKEGQIEFPAGFRIRMAEDRPDLIIAHRVVRQNSRFSDPRTSIYLEDGPYKGVFQLIEHRFLGDIIEIRQIHNAREDYYAVCNRTD